MICGVAVTLALQGWAGTITFTRDAAGRLVNANYSSGHSHGYTFDAAGNLTQSTATVPGGAVNPDSDGDGLPDAWELQYFPTLARDGTGDFDGDGFLDAAEFLAGTLPNDANSALRLLPNPAIAGGGVTVQWQSVSGKKYRLQFKNALGDADWTDVTGDVTAAGATGTKLDPTAPGQFTRYYRVQFVP